MSTDSLFERLDKLEDAIAYLKDAIELAEKAGIDTDQLGVVLDLMESKRKSIACTLQAEAIADEQDMIDRHKRELGILGYASGW